jgi:Terpene cyclase DEP1
MVSLIVHLVLGFATLAVIVKANPAIFARYPSGSQVTKLELFYLVAGVASVVLGYYFNNQFVAEYAPAGGMHNFIWGPGSWTEFIMLGYDNPAASSASQDYTIMSLLLFPVWSIIDGRRRGIKHAWLFCGFILFASSAFAWAFYLATAERQHRHQLSLIGVNSPA